MLLDFCATVSGEDDDGSAYAATSAAELTEAGSPPLGRFFFVLLLVLIAPSFLLFPLTEPELNVLLDDGASAKRFFPSVESMKNRSVLRELSDARNDALVSEARCPLSQLGVTSLLLSASGFLYKTTQISTQVSHRKNYSTISDSSACVNVLGKLLERKWWDVVVVLLVMVQISLVDCYRGRCSQVMAALRRASMALQRSRGR